MRFVVAAALLLSGTLARAQTPDEVAPEEEPRAIAEDDPSFGPALTIEEVVVWGNTRTDEKIIKRALLVNVGDQLRAGDPRFRASRFRVLSLGYFRDVQLRLDRGTRRGTVVLTVLVEERGTFILNRIFLGTSDLVPYWVGLDAGDGNLLGLGLGISGAIVHVGDREGEGGSQTAARLRISTPSLLGAPFGAHAGALWNDAVDVVPTPTGDTIASYQRLGGMAGAGFDLTRRLRLATELRLERIRVDAVMPGAAEEVSLMASLAVGVVVDTRSDPILTTSGWRVGASVEAGRAETLGGELWLKGLGRAERWFPFRGGKHVLSVHLFGGAIAGDAPVFELFHTTDWSPLLVPRPLDLVVSERRAPDFFEMGADEVRTTVLAAHGWLEYSRRLFRLKRLVYGGDVFLSAGVLGLGEQDVAGDVDGFALDLTFNAGIRLDTEIGVFELSLGNALGRYPF